MIAGRPIGSAHPARVRLAGALALALAALLIAPKNGFAQSDPAPFWMPQAPGKDDSSDEQPKPKKAKKKPPAKTPAKKSAEKPAKKKPVAHQAPAREEPAEVEEEAPPPKTTPKKHHYEPLPPIPHIEPERPPPRALQSQPAPPPAYQPPARQYQPPQPTYQQPPPIPPTYQQPSPTYGAPSQPTYQQPPPTNYPPPAPQPTAQPPPTNYQPLHPGAPPISARPAVQTPIDEQQQGAEDDSPPPPRLRRFSAQLVVGLWAKSLSDGQSHQWQVAYGADLGFAIFRWLQVDARVLRSSGTDGNAYTNATTSHLLIDARALGVFNYRILQLYGGLGSGLVIEHTSLFVQDIDSDPTTLSSSGLEPIFEFTGGVRVRPWRGLTVQFEFDGLLRQGNLEPAFLLGAGWAF